VNDRYNNKKALYVTTNKSLPELGEYLGGATSDRLFEMTEGYQFNFIGGSHRGAERNKVV
jgi:DNA replication protein DnaC